MEEMAASDSPALTKSLDCCYLVVVVEVLADRVEAELGEVEREEVERAALVLEDGGK